VTHKTESPQPGGSPDAAAIASAMELVFLGTGTSHGVPVIGCDCPVCTSPDSRNNRTRSSVLVRFSRPDATILIDSSIDFRQQMLRQRINRIDAILITHHHADHILGLDDVRVFSDRQGRINCYVPPFAADRIGSVFAYAFNSPEMSTWGGLPQLSLQVINGSVEVLGHRITPIKLPHGPRISVFGYRMGPLAYLTDCNDVPEEALGQLEGLDVLVLDALRQKPHPTHFSIDEAVAAARKINPRRTFFTHICHRVDHAALAASLPENIQPAYDGLIVRIPG